jgi:hypothetical protein
MPEGGDRGHEIVRVGLQQPGEVRALLPHVPLARGQRHRAGVDHGPVVARALLQACEDPEVLGIGQRHGRGARSCLERRQTLLHGGEARLELGSLIGHADHIT